MSVTRVFIHTSRSPQIEVMEDPEYVRNPRWTAVHFVEEVNVGSLIFPEPKRELEGREEELPFFS